ncbi:diguanylate cyclase [Saccharopolyspora sp. ASAGF58]|uniref:GGDEF domain-containing protein n=1 Tax=Saccharopolyspora sp. ASAGF58 TaxID=2719023 RepID=UPI00143FED04|nr:GGDEF domain-containing protein [Saccharopolyspora sp. ASAGF58]QIZ38121.1 GGDEF domain-containing protein [Saccharopolyspora sp. ASAGF58]
MRENDPLMAGLVPEPDRHVRMLLESGRPNAAGLAFRRLVADGANHVDGRWDSSVVLVHRAYLAWRLDRIPLALDLVAEGWTVLDVDRPQGGSAAQAMGMLGDLLQAVGHHDAARELITQSVQVARRCGAPEILAHCLEREANCWQLRAMEANGAADECFRTALELFDEALSLASPGQIRNRVQAGSARALAALGHVAEAESRAVQALTASEEAEDRYTSAIANWVLAEIRRHQHRLAEARTFASRAVETAEWIRDTRLRTRFSLALTTICRELDDPVGEAAALRSLVAASRTAMRVLQVGLGQALEQRRVAIQAQRQESAAQQDACRDPLTGLLNRRGVEHRASAADQAAVRWLVVMDVDNFKKINDAAGHTAGDAVLQEVARLLRRECRSDDLVCRWAGDEFLVLLADREQAPGPGGPELAERIRAAVETHDWTPQVGSRTRPPTVSVGVAIGPTHFVPLFAAADRALYRAKHAGRNRVEVESDRAFPPAQT